MPSFRSALLPGALLSAAIVMGCGGSTPTGSAGGTPHSIVFAASALTVKEGHSARLAARVLDAQGREIVGAPIQFSTPNADEIDVTGDGTVSGIRPGAATVRATSGGVSADIAVDVMGHPEGLLVGRLPLAARPFGAAVSRNGVVYVTRLDADSLAITDVTSRALDGAVAVGAVPTGVVFDPSGSTAYVTNQYDHSLGVVDVASATQVATVGISGDPFVVTASPDGAKLYVTNNSNTVFAVDAGSRAVVDSISVGSAPNGFAVHPNDTLVYVSAFVGGTVSEIDMRTDAVVRTFDVGGTPQDLIVSRDGSELYVANEAGSIDIWDLATGTRSATITLASGAFGMALSPDETHLYVSLPDAGRVQVVDIPSRTIIHDLDVGGRPRRIAFDYHGGTAVVANEGGWVDFVR